MITERKLQPSEIPHQLYVQNYSTASSTCLCVKRWLFSIDRELDFPAGEQASTFIFYQVGDTTILYVILNTNIQYCILLVRRWSESRQYPSRGQAVRAESTAGCPQGTRISAVGPNAARIRWCGVSALRVRQSQGGSCGAGCGWVNSSRVDSHVKTYFNVSTIFFNFLMFYYDHTFSL